MTKDNRNSFVFAVRFLRWFCPPQLLESVEGDLLQEFQEDMRAHGIAKAKRKYLLNVLKFFRPGIFLRNKFSFEIINTIMIGNYVKVAARNISKKKLYSFINAFGLSIVSIGSSDKYKIKKLGS